MIVRSKAPLRLGLAGGGTDVSPYSDLYGGCVLNATIDMYASCTIKARNDDKISFHAVDREEYYEDAASNYIEINGVLSLHKAVYNRIVKQYHNNMRVSVDVVTYSDAPAGSGLGSSSTMVVAILKAFVELLNIPLGEYDIAHLAYEIERIDLDFKGGKQDQYAATFGGFNFIEFYRDDRVIVNPLRIRSSIVNELENSMVLFHTGTSRESDNIIREQTKNVTDKVEKSIEAMHELKNDSIIMKEAILKGDLALFARYMGKSWEDKKRMASSISNAQIDEIYNFAIQSGAYSGKVTGAGGGGYMMFIIDPVKRLALERALRTINGQVVRVHFVNEGAISWWI